MGGSAQSRNQVIGLLLNLDASSPNYNTLSVFRDGQRIAQPQKLSEHLRGKVLFPHICFRNLSVQVLTTPLPTKALPFKCRSLVGAAEADVVVAPCDEAGEDGRYEVVVPVALPDEGTFAWLDEFLERNPRFVELSDRKILEWAMQSGVWKHKTYRSCNDKPEFGFELPSMDDFSLRRVINSIAPVMPRHYVVMEVKSNLIEEERRETIERFRSPHFKKVAHVVVGEPTEVFKQVQLDKLLQEKQEQADQVWKAKRVEEEKRRHVLKRQKELEAMRKRAEEARKKAAEEAKRKRAEEARKRAEAIRRKALAAKNTEEGSEGDMGDEEGGEQEETRMDIDEVKAEGVKEEDDGQKDEVEADDAVPPRVELTEHEKTLWFGPQRETPDLAPSAVASSLARLSIPEKTEGFDSVKFEWFDEAASKAYLREWVVNKKKNSRVEDLKPGEWFQGWHKAWSKTFSEWQAKHKAWKLAHAQKEREAAKKRRAEEEAKKSRRLAAEVAGEPFEEDEEEEVVEEVDVSSVENVMDVGNGSPLFKDFALEDWALLQLRYEFYTMQRAFTMDVHDQDRHGIPEPHLGFYYTKYFKKTLNPSHFSVKSSAELAMLVKDAPRRRRERSVVRAQQTWCAPRLVEQEFASTFQHIMCGQTCFALWWLCV